MSASKKPHKLHSFFLQKDIPQREIAAKLGLSRQHLNQVLMGFYPCKPAYDIALHVYAHQIDPSAIQIPNL